MDVNLNDLRENLALNEARVLKLQNMLNSDSLTDDKKLVIEMMLKLIPYHLEVIKRQISLKEYGVSKGWEI